MSAPIKKTMAGRYRDAIVQLDWSKLMAGHDPGWETLGREWHEGAFLGNGLLGAMLYRENAGALRWGIAVRLV